MAWALGGRVALAASGVLMTVFTARQLQTDERGALVLATLAGVFVGLLPKSAASAMAYQLALATRRGDPAARREAIARDAWLVAGVLTVAIGVPATIAAGIVSVALGWGALGFLIVSSSAVAAWAGSVPMGLGLADGRMGRWAIAFAGSQVGALVGTVSVILIWTDDLDRVAVGWAVGAVAGGLLSNWRASVLPLVRGVAGGTRRAQTRFTLRASGAALLNTASGRADIALLGVLDGAHAVGLYSVAVGASELVWFLGNSIATAQYGHVGNVDESTARRLTWRLSAVSAAVAAAQAVPLALIAHAAMAFVFGGPFRVSGDYLIVLLVGTVLGGPLLAITNYFTNQRGQPGMALVLAVVMLVMTAATCLLCIPRFGATGAAVGSSVGYGAGILYAGVALVRAGRQAPRPAESAS